MHGLVGAAGLHKHMGSSGVWVGGWGCAARRRGGGGGETQRAGNANYAMIRIQPRGEKNCKMDRCID